MKELDEPESSPIVSIVIPTFNSANYLEECLTSVRKQTYPHIDTIIVDNHSSDATLTIASRNHVQVFSYYTTAAQARYLGVLHSNGKYVVFLDSDVELMPDVVERCVELCEREGFDAIHVPAVVAGDNFWARCITLEKLIYADEPEIIVPIFYSRAILLKVGGHDRGLQAGEDWDLWDRVNQEGARANFIQSFQRHHEFANLSQYLRKKFFWSLTLGFFVSKRGMASLERSVPITPSRVWRKRHLISRHPLQFGGLILMFAMKAYVGGFGMLMGFLTRAKLPALAPN